MPLQQRRDGVVERILVKQTHTKDGKRPLKKEKVTETFRPHCAQPIVYERHLEQIEGKRVDRRPSKVAWRQGKKRITKCQWADDVGLDGSWSEDDEQMPDEYAEADCGWRAGPIERENPAFKGPRPGPTNEDLEWSSSYTDVMDELITPDFVDKWIEFTVAHAEAWREEHPGWETNRIEQTMRKPRAHHHSSSGHHCATRRRLPNHSGHVALAAGPRAVTRAQSDLGASHASVSATAWLILWYEDVYQSS